MEAIAAAERIMRRYAADTGLDDASRPPHRYLWTDAFGVCTFLGLYRQTGNDHWRRLALTLVDQVHQVLGRHRPDDSRSGWISGLDEAAGRRRPTAGGLRNGKRINVRGPGAPVDERMEWDRDGPYCHSYAEWVRKPRWTGRCARASGAPCPAAGRHRAFLARAEAPRGPQLGRAPRYQPGDAGHQPVPGRISEALKRGLPHPLKRKATPCRSRR